MKKTLLLKTLLLLFGLIVGSSSAWAADETASFTVTGLSSVPASFTSSPTGFTMSVAKGDGSTNPAQNNGSLRLYCKNQMTIVSTDGTTKFKSVTFNMKINASSGKYPLISAPSGSFSPVVTDNKATTTTWTAPEGGVTTITFTFPANGTSVGGNWTFSGVSVGYESSNPSITADDVPIAYDATAGSIAYTINNPVDGGAITSAEVTSSNPSNWLTVSNTLTSPIGLTCEVNNTASERTATVTLTYTYDTDKTVTKNVTVTQAANPNAYNNISDITAVSTAYKVKGTVVATNAKAFVIGDGTGYIYTYLNAAPSQSVGDKLSIDGTTGSYGQIIQFTNSATIAEATTSNYDGTPAVTILDAEGIAAYNNSSVYKLSNYVQFDGSLAKDGSNYVITVGTQSTRISYPTTAQATALDALINKTVRVKGYFAGFSSSKFTVMLESVEEVIVDAHTLTVSATNGSVEITGKTLVSGQCDVAEGAEVTATATADDGYRFVNWTVTGAGSSVSNATANPTTFTMGTEDATLTANFEAIPTHTISWSVNGTIVKTEEVKEGDAITFAAPTTGVPEGYIYTGWVTEANKIDTPTDTDPSANYVTSATSIEDITYYCVMGEGNLSTVTLTASHTKNNTTYGDHEYTDDAGNEWSGNTNEPYDDGVARIGLRSTSGSYLESPTFPENISSVVIKTYNGSSSDRDFYLKSTTDGSTADLGTVTAPANEKLTTEHSADLTGTDFKKFFIVPTGAVGFSYIKVTYGTAKGYCTSVPTPATATIPAGKEWITFCSTANLDFSEAIEGLKGAYTITAHESQAITLTATKMTGKVKAGTGLLLRAAAVDNTNAQVINIPVAATGDEQADNMLKGVTVDTEVQPTEGTNTNLGLSNCEFHPYSAAGTLAAGKAYLQVPTAQMPTDGNNARLYIVLDGEATGINAIENSELRIENLDAPMYNLAGQRVTKSYKGVVIVNGKKYINK